VDGQNIESVAQLQQRVGFKKPGDVVQVTVVRKNGIRKTLRSGSSLRPRASRNSLPARRQRQQRDGRPDGEQAGNLGGAAVAGELADQDLRQVMRSGGRLDRLAVSPDGPAYNRLSDASSGNNPDIILKVNGTPTGPGRSCPVVVGREARRHRHAHVLFSTPDGWQQRIVRLRAN